MGKRKVKQVLRGKLTIDGAGVKLIRVIGHANVKDFDPFLMLDAFDSTDSDDYIKGFPWHPHRGIETVTYLVSGAIEHGDSIGNKGVIRDGDCQWMTAGSGIVHQEMPSPSPRLKGLQFWLNLPREDKMTPPKYHDITADGIPTVQENGATVKVISGSYAGTAGAMQADYVKATFLDVHISPHSQWSLQTDPEASVYLYILDGAAAFDDDSGAIPEHQAILFSLGETVTVRTEDAETRFVLCMARPLGEPVAWGGPIVMNTDEELEQAFAELKNGTFIKK